MAVNQKLTHAIKDRVIQTRFCIFSIFGQKPLKPPADALVLRTAPQPLFTFLQQLSGQTTIHQCFIQTL
jgi:hypothetical protein